MVDVRILVIMLTVTTRISFLAPTCDCISWEISDITTTRGIVVSPEFVFVATEFTITGELCEYCVLWVYDELQDTVIAINTKSSTPQEVW